MTYQIAISYAAAKLIQVHIRYTDTDVLVMSACTMKRVNTAYKCNVL